ncbi:MAG: 50S ribosomal protein L33 [Patescibacteria group bacterium]
MSQDRLTKMECTECKNVDHQTFKNKKKFANAPRLEMKKHCKFCKKHTLHKETK